MGANEALQTILSDVDLGALLLRPLTVLEAGRLSGACRRARELVRRGEAEKDRAFLPMWHTEHVLARLERYRMPFFASGGLAFRETTSLALLLLTELLPANVIELRFDVQFARRGQQPSLLGCHQMRKSKNRSNISKLVYVS
jgi:hypothetical protein